MKTYSATGLVYGKYWGGGEGAYEAHSLQADTREELIERIEEGVKSGGLDSGMGYEKVLGAVMNIRETETREIDGKLFTHSEYETVTIGDLSPTQEDFTYNNL